jgi:phosphoglycerol transferase MdoB-like AlkP superfamily enzyme
MILGEPLYWAYFVGFVLVSILFFLLSKKNILRTKFILNNKINNKFSIERLFRFAFTFCLMLLCGSLIFLGIRGRAERKSPIRVGTAYFSDNIFLNQLGLNPNFTLLASYVESLNNNYNNFIDDKIALENIQNYLGITEIDSLFFLNRQSIPAHIIDSNSQPNLILILMESMSAYKMNRHGNKKNLTPFLDSLSKNGIYFDNFYSTGDHTFAGVFSSLFSFPTI